MIHDLFAGAGGWDVALRNLGVSMFECLGWETDAVAAATAEAAGFWRADPDYADVAEIPNGRLADIGGGVDGIVASPPCQGFSMAGKGRGRADTELIVAAAAKFGAGEDPRRWLAERVADRRSLLVLEPLRLVLDTLPMWTCWEQVPTVRPMWEASAATLRAARYSVWTGIMQAEAYGVPQTRKRAILIASRTRAVSEPPRTHSRYYPRTPDQLDPGVLPWVTMSEALGWGATQRPSMTITGGGTATGGAEPFGSAARAGLRREAEHGRWIRNGNRARSAVRHVDLPAPTVHFGARHNDVAWVTQRPATTVQGDPRVAAPGRSGMTPGGGESMFADAVRVTVEEAATLQGFPDGYPWRGTKSQKYQQVGNAIPPGLAEAVLREVL